MNTSGLFDRRRCVHVRIPKDAHAGLRTICFQRRISLQEVFSAIAEMISKGDRRMERVLDEIVTQKVQAELEGLTRRQRLAASEVMSNSDTDVLFNLINSEEKLEEGNEEK